MNDLRVRVTATGLTTHPDVTVLCGRVEHEPDDPNSATHPKVLVEVLSKSSEAYDRGEKLRQYKLLPSLRQYVRVSQDERLVEVWTRDGEAWTKVEARDGEHADLASIVARLDVKRLYDLVEEPAG